MFQARRLVAWVVLALVAPEAATACPDPPKPLWPLTAEADLIVVAEVAAVEDLPRAEDRLDSALARLRVSQTLKGPRMKTVEVPYEADLPCPAPARYAVDETVVAFLEREPGGWRTVSRSYGTLYPEGDEMQDVLTMVRAALAIQRTVSEVEEMKARKTDWLVQAVALPGTRWHGLHQLAPKDARISGRDGQPARLTVGDRHRALLAEAFVQAPRLDYTFPLMLALLRGVEDSRVDELALGVLERQLALERPPYWIRSLLWMVLARWGDARPPARLEPLDVEPWEVGPEHLRRIWSEAKLELEIPDVPAAAGLE